MAAMSGRWYVNDTSGDTQGPMDGDAVVRLYLDGAIDSNACVWNGTSVAEWTLLMDVPYLYRRIKPFDSANQRKGTVRAVFVSF